jgi:hypothetical protein
MAPQALAQLSILTKTNNMKKLSLAAMKKIAGGQPEFCERVCNYEYQACLAFGYPRADCQATRWDCIDCGCNGAC